MRRFILRLALALLAFTAGVAANALWPPIHRPRPRPATQVVQAYRAAPESAEPFTRVGVGYARTFGRGCIASETYRAADASLVAYSQQDYGSLAQAARELRREIKEAARVVERAPVKDEAGQQVGERAVVLGRAGGSVLWTQEGAYFRIRADSAERALEFERWWRERH